MSDAGSHQGLVPVAPQGQMEVASTSGTGQVMPAGTEATGAMMSYRDLLHFYVAQTKWPAGAPTPALPYDDLALFYQVHAGRPPTPLPPQLPPPSIENVDVFLTEDEVVTKEEAKEAFASVKDSFASVGAEQGKLKEGLHGLASKIDEVQGKAAEDVAALAQAADEAFSQAGSATSDLSARLADAERRQAAATSAVEHAQAVSDAALIESAKARRDQQIARAQLEADLQAATLQSQSTAERAATQAAQAMADARSATVEVPRLDATLMSLQAELHAMKAATQQAQERALRFESELSAAQDRIGAAERRAAQAEQRYSSLQKRMDDWDAFDPDLHAALNASLTPPNAGEQIQPTGLSHPTGSEATVQSAQQVHAPQGQPQATTSQPSVQAGTFQSRVYGTVPIYSSVHSAQSSVLQAHAPTQQVQPSPAVNTGGTVDSASGSDVTFRPTGAGGSSSGPNGGGTPPFPSYAGSHQQQRTGQGFTFQVKPKDPPMFRGRADDDVTTWTAKVQDFLHLADISDVQQVAYAATLLQDAASDWWHSLLKTRGGMRPRTFVEFADLLGRRFGSSTRVDRARADLRNIRQGPSESVRAYSTRFEALLGKLPSWDADWAKTQFIWGLHGRVAELVTIASPADLFSAIRKAEQVEMARSLAYMGGAQQQPRGSGWRGRGRGSRGRFATVQAESQPQAYAQQDAPGPQFNAANAAGAGGRGRGRLSANQCRKCHGYGHWAFQCPSRGGARGRRGGRRGRGGRGGGRNAGAGGGGTGAGQVSFAALTQSGSEPSGVVLQPNPNGPSVSRGGNAGN